MSNARQLDFFSQILAAVLPARLKPFFGDPPGPAPRHIGDAAAPAAPSFPETPASQDRGSVPETDLSPEKAAGEEAVTPLPTGPDAALERRARELLAGLNCDALAAKVRVVWNPRMRSTAGMAFPARSLITLNPRLVKFGRSEVEQTLRHELAHLLAQHRAGRRRIRPHGSEWQAACRALGAPGEARCHQLPLPRRQIARRYRYRCPACASEIRRVKPITKRMACYNCCRQHNRGRYDDRFRFVKILPT